MLLAAATAAQALISAYQAEQLIQQLRVTHIEQVSTNLKQQAYLRQLSWPCCTADLLLLRQVGDAKFARQHDAIQKLNLQVINM